ncbi:MAG: hypothetical protein KBT69_02470 [Oceanihabitans sp.]|nr:hypothetical protein [Oceanihabitans sp.]
MDDVLDTFVFKLFINETESLFKLEEDLRVKDELEYKLARAIIIDGYKNTMLIKPIRRLLQERNLLIIFS